MSLTITIPGAVNATTGATAPATLTVGVGVPGATGPQGPAGQGVPAGGTAGQFLTKIDGTNYNTDWTTVNFSQYLTTSAAAATYQPLSGMSSYLTTANAASTYQTLSGMSSYLTTSSAASTYAPLARGLPASGTVGQVLTKVNGTDYNASWQTLVPGDRYLSSSTTSLTISTGAKTLTIGTGLSYSSQQDIVIAYDAANHMHAVVTSYDSSTGVMVVDVQNKTGSGTYSLWTVNVGGTVPLQSVNWGEIVGTLGNQTDLATALNAKLSTASAASTYAPLAGATFTGEVATPASTTSSAGFSIAPGVAPTTPTNGEIWNSGTELFAQISGVSETLARQSWVTTQLGSYLTTSAASTTYAAKAGATFTGLVTTVLSATTGAGFNLPHGAAPTTPVNGDVWTTTSGLFARINGGTQQYAPLGSTNTFTGTNTFSGATVSFGTSTAASTINVGTGATLTATTKAINIGTNGVSGSTTNITIGNSVSGATSTTTVAGTLNATGTSLDLGNSTAAATYNIANGATTTGLTKAINIGNNGAAGSTTSIVIGQASGTSSTNIYGTVTLQGSAAATTLAADTNTTGIATTAFVVGQAGSATPLINGTAAVGTSLRYARQDHVHPTDTTRAALASPTFTGTPAAPTAAVDTNTTQIATTAYVVGQGYLKSATASSTYAPLASPALTGTPTAPTATAGTNTTQIATTAFVTTAVPAQATVAQSRSASSTTVSQNPSTTLWQSINPGFIQITHAGLGYTATGTMGGTAQGYYGARMTMGTAGAASANYRFSGASFDSGYICMSKGYRSYIDFSRYTRISGRFYTEDTWTDPQLTAAVYYGKAANSSNGDLARAGFGWKLSGNATASLRNPVLQVHNGTTLTNVTTSFALVAQQYFDWDIISDGTGNVTLFINGTQYATTSAGPNADTSYSGTSPMIWSEEFISTGTTAAYNATFGRGAIYVAQ